MEGFDIHAATDVTGFGLLGHAHEMMEASGTTAEFSVGAHSAALAGAAAGRRGHRAGRLARQRAATCARAAEVARRASPTTTSCSSPTRRPRAGSSWRFRRSRPRRTRRAAARGARPRGGGRTGAAPSGAAALPEDRDGAEREGEHAHGETPRHGRDWVEVASVGDDEEAEIIAGLLESEGIPCEIEGPSASPFPENLGALGASRVLVPPDRADEARALIAERETGRGARTSPTDDRRMSVLPPGSKLGRFEISSVLGQGAMGVVYLANDPEIDRPVAIKTVRPEAGARRERAPRSRTASCKEAKLAGRLQHPNIVTVYDVGRDGDVYFIAMEYVDGKPLTRYLVAPRRAAARGQGRDRPPGRRGARRTRTSGACSTATSSPATSWSRGTAA